MSKKARTYSTAGPKASGWRRAVRLFSTGKDYVKVDFLTPAMQQKVAAGLLFLAYGLYVVWALLSHGTWDEDCPTRYFSALNALDDPREFIRLWNRPLWILIFFLPVRLSPFAIPVIMSAISVLGAWALFRSAQMMKLQFPFLVIVFLLFQPYFFGTGRDAVTEPLAATLIAGSLYFLLRKQWLWFALLGSLLPLARAELVLHLVFWVIPLIRYRQFRYIPVLATGLALWTIAAGVITGDWLYLFNQTLGTSLEENRYGHQPFNIYLSRYFYVIGPFVFFFLILGLIRGLLKRNWTLFLDGQLLFGLALYTVFAWKIVLGQSAGFLRNLIPLSACVAVIALRGYDFWVKYAFRRRRWQVILAAGIAAATVAVFFRFTLRMHHIPTEETGYVHLAVIAALLMITCVSWIRIVGKRKDKRRKVALALTILIGVGSIGYTLATEPPDANMNAERHMLDKAVMLYKSTNLRDAPKVFCSHNWFFWSARVDKNDPKFNYLWRDSIDKAPFGSLIIWENHFSKRILGDVPMAYLAGNDEFLHIATVFSDDYDRNAFLFVKRDPERSPEQYLDAFIASNPGLDHGYRRKAEYLRSIGRLEEATDAAEQAYALDSTHAANVFIRAQLVTDHGNYREAHALLDRIADQYTHSTNWYVQKGLLLFKEGKYAEAKDIYEAGLVVKPEAPELHYNVAVVLIRMDRAAEACPHLAKAEDLGNVQARSLIDRYCAGR